MKRLVLAFSLVLAGPAMAQHPDAAVTLSPEEYNAIVAALANRDPVIAMLLKKQQEAQAEQAKKAAKPLPTDTKPDTTK